jgi:hypothetical protein
LLRKLRLGKPGTASRSEASEGCRAESFNDELRARLCRVLPLIRLQQEK